MYAVLPDLDQAVVTFLAGHYALTPLHGGRVGTRLESTSTSLRVASIGGVQPWPWVGTAQFQIEAWGGTQGQANGLIRTVLAAIYDMRGPVVGGFVTGTEVVLGPVWSPDEQTGRPRYLAQIALTAYPEGTT